MNWRANASVVITTLLLCLGSASGATITVTNSADSGPGTLRQAILDANADTSLGDVDIEFNIPGSGVQTIAPLTRLPNITRAVTIDGYTQPGASPNTLAAADNAVLLIELSGANNVDFGLFIAANGCTVRGLVINRFSAVGVWVELTDNHLIEGNFIGTDSTGTIPLGGTHGIVLSGGASNQVGGLTPASRNILGGNADGIFAQGTTGPSDIIGNFIGVGPDGATAVSNSFGVYLHYCGLVRVGGTTPEARNIVSGNAQGCYMNAGGTNVIRGNFIGTDVSGTGAIGNLIGITVNESVNNFIGGAESGAGNVISGNLSAGVALDGLDSRRNVVAGNLIGRDVTGVNALGNGFYGVFFRGASDTVIGGANASARNVISGSDTGVGVLSPNSTNNAVIGNSIFGNSSIGIDLDSPSPAGLGPTPNDAADADQGANHYQNFPDIAFVKIAGRTLRVEYRVDSGMANSKYPLTVEFFIADGGQGRTFIHRAIYSTPQAVDNIVFKPTVLPALGDPIVATATDANGNTSEFSLSIAVTRQGQGPN